MSQIKLSREGYVTRICIVCGKPITVKERSTRWWCDGFCASMIKDQKLIDRVNKEKAKRKEEL